MKNSFDIFVTTMILTLALVASGHAGDGASRQSETASAYYKAAVQGSADAQANLGALYANGAGVPQSDAAAIQWLMRAAEQGHAKAQLMFGDSWANGRGVARNNPIAYKWAYLARTTATDAETRNKADQLLATLTRQMSAAEIAEARQQADAWTPRLEASQAGHAQSMAKATASPADAKKLHAARRAQAARSSPAPRTHSMRRHDHPRFVLFGRRWGL